MSDSSDHDNVLTRDSYGFFSPITTRWMDNDIFGHVNNVTYHSYFNTIATTYLIEQDRNTRNPHFPRTFWHLM